MQVVGSEKLLGLDLGTDLVMLFLHMDNVVHLLTECQYFTNLENFVKSVTFCERRANKIHTSQNYVVICPAKPHFKYLDIEVPTNQCQSTFGHAISPCR